MMDICQQVLAGRRIPNEWKINVIVFIFKEKSDVKPVDHIEE